VNLKGTSIDTMPLTMFYTEGKSVWILSHKGLKELIEPSEFGMSACSTSNTTIKRRGHKSYCNHGPLQKDLMEVLIGSVDRD